LNAGGAAENIANAMRGSIKNRIAVLGSAATELGFKFVEAFQEKGGNAIKSLTNWITNLDVTPIVQFASSAVDTISKFVSILIGAVKFAWQFRYVILAIAGPILLYNGGLMAAALVTGIFKKWQDIARASIGMFRGAMLLAKMAIDGLRNGTILHTITTKALAIGTKIATATQWLFNAALTANPIGLVIAAIAALIAIIVILVKNWKRITEAVKNNTEKVLFFISVITGPFGLVISMVKELVSNWQNIKKAISGTGLIDAIKEIGASIYQFVKPAIDWFVGVWEKVKNTVSGFFQNIGHAIKTFFDPAVKWISGIWETVSSAVMGVFRRIWNAVNSFLQPIFSWISSTWEKIVALFKDNAIINAIKVIGGTLLSGLLAPVQGLLEILSYIPGLGHLAGKGAEKIEEFRNFLKGVDGATVNANVNVPEKVEAEISPLGDISGIDAPDIAYPDMNIPGMGTSGGRSALHGVVDISGGAPAPVIPSLNNGIPGTQTATSAVSAPSVIDNTPQALLSIDRTVQAITALIQNIDTTTTAILNKPAPTITADLSALRTPVQAARTPYRTPSIPQRYIETGQREREEAEREDPRRIPPVSREERMAYSLQERRETLGIEVSAAQGSQARIVRRPRSSNIQLTTSGGNA
jgi:uncharacterized protein YoxC